MKVAKIVLESTQGETIEISLNRSGQVVQHYPDGPEGNSTRILGGIFEASESIVDLFANDDPCYRESSNKQVRMFRKNLSNALISGLMLMQS